MSKQLVISDRSQPIQDAAMQLMKDDSLEKYVNDDGLVEIKRRPPKYIEVIFRAVDRKTDKVLVERKYVIPEELGNAAAQDILNTMYSIVKDSSEPADIKAWNSLEVAALYPPLEVPKVSDERIIEVWQRTRSYAKSSRELGLARQSVYGRVESLRQRGVELDPPLAQKPKKP